MSNNVDGIKVPSYLKRSGRALWVATLKEYELSKHDQDVLEQACCTLDLIDTMRRRIENEGVMSEGYKGQPVPHPLVNEIRQNRALFAQLIARLALPDVDSAGSGAPLADVASLNLRRAAKSKWELAHG